MPADPTPAPDWAVKMAVATLKRGGLTLADNIARRLVEVRNAPLLDAADAVVDNVVRSFDAERAILALIGTAPKGAT